VWAAGAFAQGDHGEPRAVIPFPKAKSNRRKEEKRIEELRDLRRRLVRLIVQYETERKNVAR
jgi:hypothetical protein